MILQFNLLFAAKEEKGVLKIIGNRVYFQRVRRQSAFEIF